MSDLHGIDPHTGAPLPDAIPTSTDDDVDDACRAAEAASTAWAALAPVDRAAVTDRIAHALRADADELVATANRETALGVPRLTGELERTAVQWEQYGRAMLDGELWNVTIDHADPDAAPAPRPDLRKMNTPVGPIAVYAAGNFPFAFSVAGTDTASALVVGCPVVVKAHEGHPGTSARVAAILRRVLTDAGHPDVVSVVHGFAAGRRLITHPAITAAAFTGSVAGGRALAGDAARRIEPIPFYGELGSLNPAIVTPAAWAERRDEIVTGFTGSFTLGSGQFCTKPGLLVVPEGDLSALTAAVTTAPTHPLLYRRIVTGFTAATERLAETDGVTTLVEPVPGDGYATTAGLYVVDAAHLDARSATLLDECFGPVSLVVTYRDTDELRRVLDRLPGGLTGSVHIGGDEDPDAPGVLRALASRNGRVVVDQWPTGVSVTWAMHHGGPWPASTNPGHTSVGPDAARRFLRPVAYQNTPAFLLPAALRDDNPWQLSRRVNGALQTRPNG